MFYFRQLLQYEQQIREVAQFIRTNMAACR
jgi:hypothetical protein